MSQISEIFRTFGPEYIERFGEGIPGEHRKVMKAIKECRTRRCGMVVYECDKCGIPHSAFRSCGNRNCPICQNHKTKQWLEKQMKRQLPGHHFMITFTVPQQLRRFIRSNQRSAYSAMFKASTQALKKLTSDEKFIGGDIPGFFGVLHTWGRQLHYHPHIHFVVPGGAISMEDGQWHPSRVDFYLPVKALSKIFKAKFKDEMKKAGLFEDIPPDAWAFGWNVNSQTVGNSGRGVKYLAPYVFKIAIPDSRIVKVEGRKVFFRYKKSGGDRWRTMVLDAMEFLRRFLQHVLPTGFMKVRYYGFLSFSFSMPLGEVNSLIEGYYGIEVVRTDSRNEPVARITCAQCGGDFRYSYSVLPYGLKPAGAG